MIDIHIHIMPDIDDGSRGMEDSLNMARMASDSGVTDMVVTPHCNMPGIYENKMDEVYLRKFKSLKHGLVKNEIPLKIYPGMEIFTTEDVPEKLKSGELITLNNSRYPLVEFDFNIEPDFIFYMMSKLIDFGYTPVLAHPERYRCVRHEIGMIYELYKMGVVIQVNKGSVMGHFGERVQDTVHRILRHRLACVIASDAHNTSSRNPDLYELADVLDWDYGEGCSPLLMEENPRRIINNQDIIWDSPIPFYR